MKGVLGAYGLVISALYNAGLINFGTAYLLFCGIFFGFYAYILGFVYVRVPGESLHLKIAGCIDLVVQNRDTFWDSFVRWMKGGA